MKTAPALISAAVMVALLLAAPPAGATAKASRKKNAPKTSPEARRLMSEGLGELQRGEYDAAISSLNKAARREGTVSTYFLLGWAHYQRGFKRGSVEGADRGDAQSAIDAYGMALGLDPKLSELPDASRLYFSLALCDEAVEAYDRALSAYQSALKAAPDKALIALHAARLRLKMKDESKALADLALALDKARKAGQEGALIAAARREASFAPLLENRAALGMLGGEELRDSVRDTPARAAAPAQDPAVLDKIAAGNADFKFRRYHDAIAAYGSALAADSKSATLSADQIAVLHEKIGASYNKLGQSEQAVRALQRSLQRNPLNAGARYQLALAYALSGQTSAALGALKESFSAAADPAELRRLVLMSKTDVELAAVRDLPAFARDAAAAAGRVALR